MQVRYGSYEGFFIAMPHQNLYSFKVSKARTHSSLTQAQTLACCTTTAQQQHRNFPLVFNSIIIQTANPTFLIYLKHHHLMLEWAKKYVHFIDITVVSAKSDSLKVKHKLDFAATFLPVSPVCSISFLLKLG